MKMKNAFEQNVKMGDPQSVNGQLSENSLKLEKLQSELKKYQTMLQEVMSSINYTPSSQKKSHSSSISSVSNLSVASTPHRNSISDESLSRSESESSVNNTNGHHGSNSSNGHVPAPPPLPNGHLNNGHLNGSNGIQTSSLFKLNGTALNGGSAISANGSILSPGSTTPAKTPNTLSPYSANAKDENDS